MNDNETYEYVWGKNGERVLGLRKSRISIIAAINQNKLKAPFVFEGYCNKEVFETYVEKVLKPTLKKNK